MSDNGEPPDPENEKADLAVGHLEWNENNWRTITVRGLQVKWKRSLENCLDAAIEAESGDLGMVERNLVEAATEMLSVAYEIRAKLRQ
jgi:hypothetical protein